MLEKRPQDASSSPTGSGGVLGGVGEELLNTICSFRFLSEPRRRSVKTGLLLGVAEVEDVDVKDEELDDGVFDSSLKLRSQIYCKKNVC